MTEQKRHPKCKGVAVQTLDGGYADCGYHTDIPCDECRYCSCSNGRGKDPAAKRNQPRPFNPRSRKLPF